MIIDKTRTAIIVILLLAACATDAAESIGGKGPPRAARSVHLAWQAPDAVLFSLEMTVEQSTAGSFFMACGWNTGYFGIQDLDSEKKVALFSVWDPAKGDDPNAVKPEERVEVLFEGVGVRIKRFGGEGTGGQCMMDLPWKVGQTYRFAVRAEVRAEKTAYAGYLFMPKEKQWKHLVTFRTRTGGSPLRGLHSFIEDFRRDGKSVQDVRRARFGNGWVQATTGEWKALEKARFTASGAAWEARDNIGAGVAGSEFFLATGGDTKQTVALRSWVEAKPRSAKPPEDLPQPKKN
jgi:hypothetical protein